MKQILPNLYMVTGLLAGRVYLIKDADGLTLIDTSVAGSTGKIIKQVEQLDYQARDIKRILITHAHPDHVGSLPELKQLTGAQVFASAGERAVIEGNIPVLRPSRETLPIPWRWIATSDTTFPGTPVDREIGEGDMLDEVMGGLQVLATPGHAPGHLSFWQPHQRILICGDVIMNLLGLRLPLSPYTFDMEENKRSIRRLADLDAATVCFGHGKPLLHNTGKLIRTFARKVRAR